MNFAKRRSDWVALLKRGTVIGEETSLRIGLFCCVFLAFFEIGLLYGAEHRINASLGLRETYDDNVYLRDIDDLEHRFSPAVEFARTSELSSIAASAQLDIREYDDYDEFNTVEQVYGLSASAVPGPNYELSFNGSYRYDYTFNDVLEESGIIAERSRRKYTSLAPGVTFLVGPRDSMGLSYSFTMVDYDTDRYEDYDVNGLNLSWFHEFLNARTTFIGTVGALRAVYDREPEDTEQTTYRATAGFEHEISERADIGFTVGGRYTESEFSQTVVVFPFVIITSETSYETGLLFDAFVRLRRERSSVVFKLNRDVANSIYGEDITRDQVTVNLDFETSDRTRIGMSAAYRRSETEGYIDDEERQAYWVRPRISYLFSEEVRLELGYNYTWTENRKTDDTDERNRVYLQLSMNWPGLFEW